MIEAFRKCQKNSRPLRMKTYEELLEKYEEDLNSNTMSESRRKAKIVRDTIDGEVLRTKFRDIRRIMRPRTSSSLSQNFLFQGVPMHNNPILLRSTIFYRTRLRRI